MRYFFLGLWSMLKGILPIPLIIYMLAANPLTAPLIMWSGPSGAFDLRATLIIAPGIIVWLTVIALLIAEHGEEVEKKTTGQTVTSPKIDLNVENEMLKKRIKALEKELADNILIGNK